MKRFDSPNQMRIEILLGRLLAYFEGKPEEQILGKILSKVQNDELSGADFLKDRDAPPHSALSWDDAKVMLWRELRREPSDSEVDKFYEAKQ